MLVWTFKHADLHFCVDCLKKKMMTWTREFNYACIMWSRFMIRCITSSSMYNLLPVYLYIKIKLH